MTIELFGRTAAVLVLGAALATVAGCGSAPPMSQIHGTVTFDGKPLAAGVIQFMPTGPTGQTVGGTIKDGVYELQGSVGEMKVSINASEVIGKKKMYDTPDSPLVDDFRNLLPPRYNINTELKASLKAGPNEVNFDLTSGKK
jgi:hypothetical protein